MYIYICLYMRECVRVRDREREREREALVFVCECWAKGTVGGPTFVFAALRTREA